jgi:hypothetical protein
VEEGLVLLVLPLCLRNLFFELALMPQVIVEKGFAHKKSGFFDPPFFIWFC